MDDADMCGKDFVGVCVREAIGLGNKRRYWPMSGSWSRKTGRVKTPHLKSISCGQCSGTLLGSS